MLLGLSAYITNKNQHLGSKDLRDYRNRGVCLKVGGGGGGRKCKGKEERCRRKQQHRERVGEGGGAPSLRPLD